MYFCHRTGCGLEAGGWRLEAGAWRLEAGGWRLEAGGWSVEAGAWRLEAGGWSVEGAYNIVGGGGVKYTPCTGYAYPLYLKGNRSALADINPPIPAKQRANGRWGVQTPSSKTACNPTQCPRSAIGWYASCNPQCEVSNLDPDFSKQPAV